jgi:hypothetical protein
MPLSVEEAGVLLALGFGVGAYGTLIGAGGGFVLVPMLLLLRPGQSPASVTAVSLTVVFFNAYGGTWAYAQRGRIDYPSGVLFALAGIPGALLGTWVVRYIPRGPFDVVFSLLLLILAAYLIYHPMEAEADGRGGEPPTEAARRRQLLIGSLGSAYLGVVSSLLGIGGGILHVPFLIRVLGFAPHVATATSHFVLALVAFTGTLAHIWRGELSDELAPTAMLALGVMMGAPLGAAFSHWLRGPWLVRLLALALAGVGVRLLWRLCG